MNLNSFLTPYQAEKYPHFNVLLQDLFVNKLGSNAATRYKEDEKTSLSTYYIKTRDDYETFKFVYDMIWDILTDKSTDDKLTKQLETSFLSLEMKQSMKIPLQDKEAVENKLNIFNEFLGYEELKDKAHSWTCSLLKKKFIEEGVMIMELLGKEIHGDNADLVLAKLNQLPSLLSSKLEDAKELKKKKIEIQQTVMEQTSRYSCVLLESLEIIKELIEKQMIEFQGEKYTVTQQSLKVQADALLLKIKSLYLEVLNETYTKDTIPALKTISKQLDKQVDHIRGEIQTCRARLNRYESVGQEFNSIVSDYTNLREAFKQKKWTLDKLKSYCP